MTEDLYASLTMIRCLLCALDCDYYDCNNSVQMCPRCRYFQNRKEEFYLDRSQSHKAGHAIHCKTCIREIQTRDFIKIKKAKYAVWDRNKDNNKGHDCKFAKCNEVEKKCSFCKEKNSRDFFIDYPRMKSSHAARCRIQYYKIQSKSKGIEWKLTNSEAKELISRA